MEPSSANLTSYCIALRQELGVGTVSVAIEAQDSPVASHPRAIANLRDGYALTGGGADVHYGHAGSFLWMLEPTTETALQDFGAGSKDHEVADPSSLTAYALALRSRLVSEGLKRRT